MKEKGKEEFIKMAEAFNKQGIRSNLSEGAESKLTASHRLIIALALVSIIGFAGIISETLFDFNSGEIVEALWMLVIGLGLIFEAQLKRLWSIRSEGLTSTNTTHLITAVVGFIAMVAGILSFPFIRLENQGFLAVKGIISFIAIIIIIVQTWIVK